MPGLCSLRHVWTTIPEVGSSMNTIEGLATCRQPRPPLDLTGWQQQEVHHAAATACRSVQQLGLSELGLQHRMCSTRTKSSSLHAAVASCEVTAA